MVPVVINATAGGVVQEGGGEALRRRLAGLFAAAGWTVELHWLAGDELPRTLGRLRDAGGGRIVVGGGDGTLSLAANLLAGSGVALGVLPLGTFNHFARDLGMPAVLEDAVAALAGGTVQAIDVGEINGRVFLNNAFIGLYPYAVRRRERYRRHLGLRKFPAMAYALAAVLWRLPVLGLRLRAGQDRQVVRTPFVLLGNNRYLSGPLAFIRRQSFDEGVLSVFYTRRPSRRVLVKIAVQTLLGRMARVPELDRAYVPEVIVESRRRRLTLAVDGEVARFAPPLRARIRRRALKVIVPAGGGSSTETKP